MARATKWTEEKVKALMPDAGGTEHRKLVAPNLYLYLRAKADGTLSRHWQYRAQVGGSRRWLSLSSFPEVGLAKADAERKAHDTVHEAAKKGDADHPVIAARQERKAKKAMPTVVEVFDEWIGADTTLHARADRDRGRLHRPRPRLRIGEPPHRPARGSGLP
jgi:hypothetical protein